MDNDNFVELVRLDDAELEFAVTDPGSAGIAGAITPASQTQIVFRVAKEDLPYAEELLDEYRRMQAGPLVPSEAPPPPEGDGGKTE
jgi:hypothetical protein